MYQQNEGNISTQQQWTDLHPIDSNHIDTTYLPELVVNMDERILLELLNAKLDNPRFEVKFDFDKVERMLIEGEFPDIALFYHDFTIQKPTQVLATVEAIQEVFDVEKVTEDDTTVTFQVYLDEGPFAETIEETVSNINGVLGPNVESKAKQLGLNDYHMTFNISLGY